MLSVPSDRRANLPVIDAGAAQTGQDGTAMRAAVDVDEQPRSFRRTGPRIWLTMCTATFFLVSVSVLAVDSNLGQKLFYVPMAVVTGWTTIGVFRSGIFTNRKGIRVRNVFRTYEARWEDVHSIKAPARYGGWRNTGIQFLLSGGGVINAALYSAGPLNRPTFADEVVRELRSEHERSRSQ